MRLLTVLRNNSGFTLVEVMIAMVISIIGMLAMANVAVMAIDANMGNLLRDEAVKIADERINGTLQLTDINGNALSTWPSLKSRTRNQLAAMTSAAASCQPGFILRDSKGVRRDYSMCWRITQQGANSNAFLAEVWVGWNYKGGNVAGIPPTGRRYQHGISTLITKLATD